MVGEGDLMFAAMRYQAEYFSDMTFSDEYESVFENLDFMGVVSAITVDDVSFRIAEIGDGVSGQYDAEKNEVTIDAKHSTDGTVLMHEMIHVFERKARSINPALCELLVARLWEQLRHAVPDFESKVIAFLEVTVHDGLESIGGRHSLLFLLKSYDLDMRLGIPFGTVLGYGSDGR